MFGISLQLIKLIGAYYQEEVMDSVITIYRRNEDYIGYMFIFP